MAFTVNQIQEKAVEFANNAAQNMENMQTRINMTYTSGELAPSQLTSFGGNQITADVVVPEMPDDYTLPAMLGNAPGSFAVPVIVTPTIGTAPEFSGSAPTLNLPAAPVIEALPTLRSAPELMTPTIPTAPNIVIPNAPSISAVALPVMPALVVPTFSSTLPVNDITAPTETFRFAETEYSSAMLDALKSKLMTDLEEGGYGINPTDEALLWQRGRDREMRNAEYKVQDSVRQVAGRGFSMPPGAMNALIAEAQQAAQFALSGLSREIMIKRADLYMENYKFTIEQVKDVEKTLINYYGAMMERGLNAARSLVELSIASYNARIANFNLKLEAYKASAQVYETLIRAASLKLQAYKDQIEGARLSVEVQKLYVDTYKAQLDAQQAVIGIYTARVGATRMLVEIEQAKLSVYRASIDAYSAQVNSQSQRVQLYEATIRGEAAKINAFGATVDAYGSTVQAYAAKANVAESQARVSISAAQLKLDVYKTDISRYSMELDRSNNLINQSVAQHSAEMRKYDLNANIAIKKADLSLDAAKSSADLTLRAAEAKSRESISNAQMLTNGFISRAGLYGNMASSYGSLGAAAVSSAIGITTAAAS